MKKKIVKVARRDAVATVGFDGDAALVDGTARSQYEGMTTAQLAEGGFYRAATVSALCSGSREELELVAGSYNRLAGTAYPADALLRLFGVAPASVPRILVL